MYSNLKIPNRIFSLFFKKEIVSLLVPGGGKRGGQGSQFSAWGGKRGDQGSQFSAWGGKRGGQGSQFSAWGGKRSDWVDLVRTQLAEEALREMAQRRPNR